MYFIDVKSAKVYILRRENSWQPELLREGITELSANNGETWSCIIDDEEKYLYTRNHLGIFVRINLTEKDDSGQYKVEKLLEHRWDFEAWVSDHCSYLAYSRVEDCFYFAEEVLSTYEYKQLIRANDRATMLNLMKGLNGYTLCSGIICEELNGGDYCAVPLESDKVMTIGYLCRKGVAISPLGQKYLDEIRKYKNEDARYR